MTMQDNQAMQKFMFWARTLGENAYFRWIWTPLRILANLSQSAVLQLASDWFEASEDPVAKQLLGKRWLVTNSQVVAAAMRLFYSEPEFERLFRQWWVEKVLPLVPEQHRRFVDEVYRYDWLTRPLYYDEDKPTLDQAVINGDPYWVRKNVRFEYRVRELVQAMKAGETPEIRPDQTVVSLYFRPEFWDYVDNMEVAIQFVGVELDEPGPGAGPLTKSSANQDQLAGTA
jgi:hypothetical protein